MKSLSFDVTCPRCGGITEHLASGRVVAGTQVSAIVQCTTPRCARAYQVMVHLRPVTEPSQTSPRLYLQADDVLVAAAEWCAVDESEVRHGGSRSPRPTMARRVAILILREEGLSYPAIARAMGGFDHTSIVNAAKRATDEDRQVARVIRGNLTMREAV